MWLLVSGMHRQLPGQRTVIGYRKGQFAPTDLVTREQLPIMLQVHWKHGDNGELRYFTRCQQLGKRVLMLGCGELHQAGKCQNHLNSQGHIHAEAAALMAKLHQTPNTIE